jgi:carboxyl-terminal processing protease
MKEPQARRPGRIAGCLGAAWLTAAAACSPSTVPPADPAPAADAEPVTPELAAAVFDSAWSLVYRTYYDTTFGGVDWRALRDELRPAARTAGTADSLRAVIGGMLDLLGDSHFAVIPARVADALEPDSLRGATGEPGDVGVELRVVDDSLIVVRVRPGSAASRAGVRPGWALDAVAGRTAADMLEVLDHMEEDRRVVEARVAWAAEARLAGRVGDTVTARLTNGDGDPVEVRLVADRIPGTPVRFGNLPTMFAELRYEAVALDEGCAGMIAFDVWMTPILPRLQEAFDALRDCDGIVLDLRGNPGGVAGMVMGVSGYFMDERRALGRLITREHELSLVSMPRRVDASGEAMTPYDGPLALLVDGMSMSTSEIFAGGLQEVGRAMVFGQTTGGQALPAMMARLPNDDVLMHVFANLVTPEGVRLEGRGVVPDREVPLDRQELLQGQDATLDAALDWIRSEARTRAAGQTKENTR